MFRVSRYFLLQFLCIALIEAINDKPSDFIKIGAKEYYIAEQEQLNWFGAAHKCRQLDANLAHLVSQAELDAVSKYLVKSEFYWLDVNDLGQAGTYASIATGFSSNFLKWAPGQPQNIGGTENCVHLWFRFNNAFDFKDGNCKVPLNFICEKNLHRNINIDIATE